MVIRTATSRGSALRPVPAWVALTSGLSWLLGSPATAQQPTPPDDPRYETVVTPVRSSDGSRAHDSVSRQDIDRQLPRTTPEAIAETPGVLLQQTNYGGGAAFIRGQHGNRVLLLVDGIRLNNSTFRAGPNQYLNTIDPMLVERIDITRGPGSVEWGSDAIGGSVNVLTRPALLSDTPFAYADVRLATSTADRARDVAVRSGVAAKNAGAVATGHARAFSDVTIGGGRTQPFTGYEELSGALDARWAASPAHGLRWAFSTTQQFDVPRTDQSTPLDFRKFTRQGRTLSFLRHDHHPGGAFFDLLRTTLSWQRQTEILDRFRIERDRVDRDVVVVDTLGAQVHLRRKRGESAWWGGIDSYHDQVSASAALSPISRPGWMPAELEARYPDAAGHSTLGIFLHGETALSPRLIASAGARASLTRISLPLDDRLPRLFPEQRLDALAAARLNIPGHAGSLCLRHHPWPSLALHAGLVLGFRAPNIDDLTRLGSEGPTFVVPSRDLDPERAVSAEAGFKWQEPGVRLGVSYAYMVIDDAIAKRPASWQGWSSIDGQPTARLENAHREVHHAIEGELRLEPWRRLELHANVAWFRGRRLVEDGSGRARWEATSKVPPPFGLAGLGWQARRFHVETLVRFALPQRALSETDRLDARICPNPLVVCRGTSGWATWAIRAGTRIGDHLRLACALENLLDLRYRVHASGIDGVGRNLRVMLEGRL